VWASGELERRQLWLANQQARIANRVRLEQALAGDPDAARALFVLFEALLQAQFDWENPIDDEFEDSLVVVNQNI